MVDESQVRTSPHDRADILSRPGVEHITQRERLVSLLENLRLERSLLSVQIDQRPVRYNSAVLKVDAVNGALLLDELTPADGHQRIQVGSKLRVIGSCRGVPVTFRTHVEAKRELKNVGFYQVALPDAVDYRQRRAYFRAHAPRVLQLQVVLQSETGDFIGQGRILNLSLGGFGALFAENIAIQALDRVLIEPLQLPEDTELTGTAQIRWLQLLRAEKQVRIGVRLDRLVPEQERLLRHTLIALQREEIRRQVRE